MKLTNETKVGLIVAGTGVLIAVFAWVLGAHNPLKRTVDFYVTYNFAGGIEIGSPVRVSGIKVGKVEEIDFFVPAHPSEQAHGSSSSAAADQLAVSAASPVSLPVALKEPGSDPSSDSLKVAPVRLKISVLKKAAIGVRRDSRFYINLAGIIGERYIDITPGSFQEREIQTGDVVPGVDPPRIDQLLSQSFDLAGRITDLIEKNKGDFSKSIETLYKLSGNLNQTLQWVDKSKVFKSDFSALINNLTAITTDVKRITDQVHEPEGEKTLHLMHELLWRLEPLNSTALQKFFQEEGIRARLF